MTPAFHVTCRGSDKANNGTCSRDQTKNVYPAQEQIQVLECTLYEDALKRDAGRLGEGRCQACT